MSNFNSRPEALAEFSVIIFLKRIHTSAAKRHVRFAQIPLHSEQKKQKMLQIRHC